MEKVLWCGSKNQPPVSEAHTPWRRICNTCDPMAPPLLRAPSSRDPHGGGPRPMPRVAPEGPGARPRAHAMASPSGGERSVGLGCEQGAGPARAVSGARPRRGGGDASEAGSGPPPPAQICSQGPGRQAGAGQGPGTRRRHPEVGVGWMLWGCRRRLPRFRPGESPGITVWCEK